MWTQENRARYDRSKLRYSSDLTDEEWLLVKSEIPRAKRGGNKRTVDVREVVNGLMCVLGTSCQWAVVPKDLPPRSTVISPLLASIFLHYVLDLWVHQWRRRHARGRVSILRYADDFLMGFESLADARQMLADLKERLATFGLLLHEDKTRLIEFGLLPARARQRRGERRPETFAFLDFTHYCGWTRDGRFIVKHNTQSNRL